MTAPSPIPQPALAQAAPATSAPSADHAAHAAPPARHGLSLRLQIHLIVGALTAAFVLAILALQLRNLSDSVHEETAAANRVAAQLLDRTAWVYAAQGTRGMQAFLQGLGRVRSNEVLLFDREDRLLYQSPPSPYKAGRSAPAWFDAVVAPPAALRAIEFPDGRLEVRANASRSVLDAWDDLSRQALLALGLLAGVNALVFWAVGRAVRPFGRIEAALQAGSLEQRLPPLRGREAGAIAAAFNRMAELVSAHVAEQLATERRAMQAERQLSDSRALAQWMAQHIEAERKLIARELHDELGQSVTAMRSMALAIAGRAAGKDASTEQAARVIADEAARLYDAMHGIIPRLAPLVLDSFGLVEALADLLERTRRSQPGLDLRLDKSLDPQRTPLDAEAALALYRTAQEGMTNALQHGQASAITLRLSAEGDRLTLEVSDNGRGLPASAALPVAPEVQRPPPPPGAAGSPGEAPLPPAPAGHFGLRWLRERAQALGGTLELLPQATGGLRLCLSLPRVPPPASAPHPGPATAP